MTAGVASPFSTGSGGSYFEAKVQAAFLVQLLIGGRVPCLPSGAIQSIRLQARQAGFQTDDLVITVSTAGSSSYRLLAQVKHHAKFIESDPDFCDALSATWIDFNNGAAFSRGSDALALITGPHSDQTIQHVRPILDWARTSATSTEFVGKVETAQFSSDRKRAYLEVFKKVLATTTGSQPPDEDLWQFLKHFHLLSFDFDAQSGKDEASILTILGLARSPTSDLDAQAVWDGLIAQAQEWNKNAGTFTRSEFPERLRVAVLPHRSNVQREAISKLREHCELVLNTIDTAIAPGIHLPRTDALAVLADTIESSQIVVVQGAPGSGKSAAVKMLVESLPNWITPFAFKAQEFNHPHIHQFLTSVGVGLTVQQLQSEFALLPRKVLLIDGAERIFELDTHEALRHLLHQFSGDHSWTVVITCRESAAQSLREHLLAQWGVDITTVTIPSLTSEELGWVSRQAPKLVPLIANHRLARLLRVPFILSIAWKAFPDSTGENAASDIDEIQFKNIVWRDYVERVGQAQGGMPIKRGQCMLSVSVERARRMSLFVPPDGLDADALKQLVDDGVLIRSFAGGFAPAHDVLEDWAVARFIAQQFEARGSEPTKFIDAVGAEPAIRRCFRLWLSEALATPGAHAVSNFVLSAFQRLDLLPMWRDEIAVAVLQSESAGEFIRSTEKLLLENEKALYRRLVHVLRTACKGPNESLLRMYGLAAYRSHLTLGSVFVVPVGSGWAELILFTRRHLTAFELNDADTVLALLKDWSQGLGPSKQTPPEAPAVAQICLKYWQLLTAPDVYADRLEKEFLQLLLKIPDAAPDEVTKLIRSALADELARKHHARTVLEHVTKSIECQPLCTHLPKLVVEVAESTWRLRNEDREEYSHHRDLDELFGFVDSVYFHYFPQSALQGPFTFLLAAHKSVALDFIIGLINQGAVSYSQSEMGREAHNVQLPISAGSRTLIASPRLWALYRSMMPGPQVMECALMALEAWLLGQAKLGRDIRQEFKKILEESSSVATIAVLVSVATAYPAAVGDEVLPLLEVEEFYRWDFQRSHLEHSHTIDVRPMLGAPTGGIEEIYYQERKDSASLSHRKSNLEELAFRLQWTPLRDRVWAILDRFHSALPPSAEQSDEDRTWRIALHRMDARHFKAAEGKEPGQVILTPGEPPPDLKQYIAKAAEDLAPTNSHMRLAMWGMSRFRRETQSSDAFPDWRDALREAQALSAQPPSATDVPSLSLSGPVFVAAYLVRDHYAELQPELLDWCRETIVKEILRKDAERTFEARISKNSFDGSRPSAYVAPLLLREIKSETTRGEIEKCIAVAVTHTSDEVRGYAAEGVRDWLWELDAGLSKACVGGLFELAGNKHQVREAHRAQRGFTEEGEGHAILVATSEVRDRIVKRGTVSQLSGPAVDPERQDWPELLDALKMIKPDTRDADLQDFVMSTLASLLREAEAAEAWKSNERRRSHYELQYAFASLFSKFALARSIEEAEKIGRFIGQYVDRCPKYLGVLLEPLPFEEDRIRSGAVFWSIWNTVSKPIFEHQLLRGSDRIWRYDELRKLVRVLLFADVQFKEGVKQWAPVTEHRDFFEGAAIAVGNTPAGFGALLAILSSVGQVFLPEAISWLLQALEQSNDAKLLSDRNAAFQLEVLIRKTCYGYSTKVRQNPDLHRAALRLLDSLVESGSHTGFRLRDYIVAPLPAAS